MPLLAAMAVALVIATELSHAEPVPSMCAQYWQIAERLYKAGQEPVVEYRERGAQHVIVMWAEPDNPDDPDAVRNWTKLAITFEAGLRVSPATRACTIGAGDGFQRITN